MGKGFFGKTYLYPTPHGNCEIGVLKMNATTTHYTVGYVSGTGLIERVESACIPSMTEPVKLQQRLDKRAAKLGLEPVCKDVVVRECVDNAAVLPPASKMPPVAGLPYAPEALVTQYGKALGGTLEVVRFGAMLCDQDDALSSAVDKAPQGRRGDESLKGWLETHCPTIKYGTAMGYKALAEDLRDICKIPENVPLTLAVPEDMRSFIPPENFKGGSSGLNKLAKIQQRVLDMVDGKSARQLRIGLEDAATKPKGGARAKEKLTEEQKRERQLAAAKAWWTGAVSDMADQVSCVKSHALLDQATLDAVFCRVGFIRDALKEAGAKE